MRSSETHIDWLTQHGVNIMRELKVLSARPLKIDWGTKRMSSVEQGLITEQLQLRQRAAGRFPDPDQWLWTDRSLQQASDWQSALAKAALLPPGCRVIDICCGAGSDLVALSQSHEVVGVDRDREMLKLARHNLQAHGRSGQFLQAELPGALTRCSDVCLHADPDRRRGQERDTRTINAESFSPPLSELMQLGERSRACIIKLAPATNIEANDQGSWQRMWLGVGRECPQQLIARGELAWKIPELQRGAMLVDQGRLVYVGDASSDCPVVAEPDQYVYEPHAVLYAAGLTASWSIEHDLMAMPFSGSYFTGRSKLVTPWAQTFEVLDHMSWHERQVRKWLNSHQAGTVEVKTRHVPLDANQLQRQLSKPEGQPITCLLYRVGKSIRAVLARRITM